jgi:hypothetical protein
MAEKVAAVGTSSSTPGATRPVLADQHGPQGPKIQQRGSARQSGYRCRRLRFVEVSRCIGFPRDRMVCDLPCHELSDALSIVCRQGCRVVPIAPFSGFSSGPVRFLSYRPARNKKHDEATTPRMVALPTGSWARTGPGRTGPEQACVQQLLSDS